MSFLYASTYAIVCMYLWCYSHWKNTWWTQDLCSPILANCDSLHHLEHNWEGLTIRSSQIFLHKPMWLFFRCVRALNISIYCWTTWGPSTIKIALNMEQETISKVRRLICVLAWTSRSFLCETTTFHTCTLMDWLSKRSCARCQKRGQSKGWVCRWQTEEILLGYKPLQ